MKNSNSTFNAKITISLNNNEEIIIKRKSRTKYYDDYAKEMVDMEFEKYKMMLSDESLKNKDND